MPPVRISIVRPDANQTTITEIATSALSWVTVQVCDELTMPRCESTQSTAPELGCNSIANMKHSVVSPTTKGRKNIVRKILAPGRFERSSSASP